MRISRVEIKKHIELKIIRKHNINPEEVDYVLKHRHVIFRVSKERYVAIGYHKGYITIFFEMEDTKAVLVSAYKSSKKQIKYYEQNG